ncbi:LLM class flavin-dependent oxidoreductase [uncultured Friedmanniella sp.]|uniref:LLM class flavin-dependent oxidoreductase n=1 Tax=uncultured Friedmanniella sp. TaxID=335381 RepID=UPI0035CC8C34
MITVGVALLPEVNPALDTRWSQLESLGFAHGWSLDHLAWRAFVDEPWYATVPALTAAALTTSRLVLGTFVASPNFRHPVPFAKDLMTLDAISGGRLNVGVGAGGPGFDAAVLGGPALTGRQRADRFEEFVTLLDLLLRTPRTSWSGRWFSAVEARMIPGGVQQPRPPLLVAGNGPRGIRLALATGDGWVTNGTVEPPGAGEGDEAWWGGVAESVRRLERAAGPDPTPAGFRRVLDMAFGMGAPRSLEQVRDQIGRASALGFTDVVIAWPRSTPPLDGSPAVLAELGGLLQDGGLEP